MRSLLQSRTPIDVMDSDVAMDDLVRSGTCIPRACVSVVGDSDYEVVWSGFAGRSIAVGNQVILSRSHPLQDARRHPFVVLRKERFKLVMQLTHGVGPEDVGSGEWRADQAVNSVSHDHMASCVQYFAAQQTWPLQRLIANG